MQQSEFQKEFPLEKRISVSQHILQKYPDRVPVIAEKAHSEKTIPAIKQKKFLVPVDITAGKFLFEIRKQLPLTQEQAIFIFVRSGSGIMPASNSIMGELYNKYKDPDGFLYITYSGENTFG